MDPLLASIAGEAFAGVRERLDRLGSRPPQVLLLEGGTEAQRLDAARYWACRCKCPQADAAGHPCLACAVCNQIAHHEHMDLLAFDGRISNAEDEANPDNPVRALNMDNIRALKSVINDPPHGHGCRVVVLMGLEGRRSSAANALLKALEEPSPTTVFVLLAMQREQILPTLVSRSFCLTLPWPDPEAWAGDPDIARALADFFRDGKSLFDITGRKGFDVRGAQDILLAVQKALLRVMAGRPPVPGTAEAALAGLAPEDRMLASRWLAEAQEGLALGVTPARVIEAFTASIYTRLHAG